MKEHPPSASPQKWRAPIDENRGHKKDRQKSWPENPSNFRPRQVQPFLPPLTRIERVPTDAWHWLRWLSSQRR